MILRVLHIAGRTRKKHKLVEHCMQLVEEDFIQNLLAAGYNCLDMRCLNGRRSEDAAFQDFLKVVHRFLTSRNLVAAGDRREDTELCPTALAPSIRALHERVRAVMNADPDIKSRLQDGSSKVPSVSTFATMMSPAHPDRLAADLYSGKAGIKYAMQARTARKTHPDAHYNNMQSLLLRDWIAHIQQSGTEVLFISDDDKCKISVGAPGYAQTAVTRQKKVIVGDCSPPLMYTLCSAHTVL